MAGLKVGILGATGMVGQAMLEVLAQRNFPVAELRPMASGRSAGQILKWKKLDHTIVEAKPEAFEGLDLVLASAGAAISAELVPHAVKAGAVVIDNTSHFRMHHEVPLVVPEVNAEALKGHQGVIANPNCSTAQLVVVLHALRALAPLKRVVVSTYQSVSGAGKEAVDELVAQSGLVLSNEVPVPSVLPHPIAFDLIPAIDVFLEDGRTKEEWKMEVESQKILGLPQLALTATCVRVPVFVGHSEAVNVEFEQPVAPALAREVLAKAPGVVVMDEPATHRYPRPGATSGTDPVYVGRLRRDPSHPCALDMWVVSDNLRKGAALNAVQIAEALVAMELMRVPAGAR